MFFIKEAMSDLLARRHASGRKRFQTSLSKERTRSFFKILIYYFWDVLDAKDLSAIKHKISVGTPCVRSLTTMHAARSLHWDRYRTLTRVKLTKSSVRSQTTQSVNQHPSHTPCTPTTGEQDPEQPLESVPLSP